MPGDAIPSHLCTGINVSRKLPRQFTHLTCGYQASLNTPQLRYLPGKEMNAKSHRMLKSCSGFMLTRKSENETIALISLRRLKGQLVIRTCLYMKVKSESAWSPCEHTNSCLF